ncbi:MAG: hypothetical protein K6F27_06430 [Ruminococcus sp.]|nr:hypothetical protein [Ruminococcus sp.]
MLTELDEQKYIQTMQGGMKNVTDTAEQITDIWDYAHELARNGLISQYGYSGHLIEAVYANSENTYQHVLLFTDTENCYMVIVIDVARKAIAGHHLLDLNKEYGIS